MPSVRTVPADQLTAVAARGELFALLDACDEPSVSKRCRNSIGAPAKSLYQGKSDEHFWHIAPYLATVSPTELEWILEDLWRSPWGCFVISGAGMQALSNHFRRFLQVKGTDGKTYLFCFYDPRVLRAFLSSSSPKEIERFYGPVSLFGVTAPDGSHNVDMLRL
jgi:hypothetical protein